MIKAAEDPDLKQGLSDHREETGEQITKLEEIFHLMGMRTKGEKCDAIDGILDEGDEILETFGETPAGDAAIIFSCQAVEHYEITRYGSMHAFALALGLKDVAGLLQEILGQERGADKKLSSIAKGRVNFAAENGERSGDSSHGAKDERIDAHRMTDGNRNDPPVSRKSPGTR